MNSSNPEMTRCPLVAATARAKMFEFWVMLLFAVVFGLAEPQALLDFPVPGHPLP